MLGPDGYAHGAARHDPPLRAARRPGAGRARRTPRRRALRGRHDDLHAGDPGDSMYVVRQRAGRDLLQERHRRADHARDRRAKATSSARCRCSTGARARRRPIARTDVEAIVIDRGDLDEFLRRVPGGGPRSPRRDRPAPAGDGRAPARTRRRATSTRGRGHAHDGDEASPTGSASSPAACRSSSSTA